MKKIHDTVYYKKLAKATLLISTVPMIVICVMAVYERLSFVEAIAVIIAVFFGSIFFAKPYMEDLSSLNHYVNQLALDRRAEIPPLSFLGNVNELSESVKNLSNSWENRKIELESALAESGILFDTLPDILLMINAKGMIVRANNSAFGAIGKSIINGKISEIIEDKHFLQALQDVQGGKKSVDVEITVKIHNVKKDYLAMMKKFPVNSPRGIDVVIVMHDITESRKTRQMTKDFVANASHEIRTPLTSIVGFLENMQDMNDSDDDREASKKFVKIMHEQAGRMVSLVNDLLSLSKVEVMESQFPDKILHVDGIINDSINKLKWIAKENNVAIKFKILDNIPEVIGEPSELEQVFTNLVSNAIKYSKNGGKVEITASVEKKTPEGSHILKTSNGIIVVSVKDYGEGIGEEHIPRLTERFYRVDKVRSRSVGGSGLGLAIVKHIINRHLGDLIIESKLGEGSTFTIRLPIPEADDIRKIRDDKNNDILEV